MRGGAGRKDGGRRPDTTKERPRLPRDVYRDLKAAAKDEEFDDVAAAYAQAGEALNAGRPEDAEQLLVWAKQAASRSAMIREALGVAYYLQEKFDAARSELQTYRRLSGRVDQNHLLADCVRAQGRPEKVEEYIAELLEGDVGLERSAEGVMVLAGARADGGDVEGALSALTHVPLDDAEPGPTHARVWYLAADLHRQLGDVRRERELLERVADVDEGFLDVADRLRKPATDPPAGG